MQINLVQSVFVSLILLFTFGYQEIPKWQNYSDENFHVYFFDIGQGDSALVKTENRKLIIIDGGPDRTVVHRISEVVPFWVNKIDAVVATHSHKDHIAGLIHILDKYDVNCVIYDFSDDPISETDKEFRELAVKEAKIGENCNLENLSIVNYFPVTKRELISDNQNEQKYQVEYSLSNNENLGSIISHIYYNEFDVLFTADAENPAQNEFLKHFSKDIEILKVPHQGSRDAFNPVLIKSLSPELGIISVGKNSFGHPHKETISGYDSLGVDVMRTDQDGTIHIKSDGFNWEVVE